MYREQKKSIIKHLDFLILDMAALLCSYTAANIIRNGWDSLPSNAAFLSMAFVLLLMTVMVAVFNDSYGDILRRGYLIELKNVLVQNVIVLVLAITYMFMTKAQPQYSRLVFGYCLIINVVLTYAERLFWKRVIRRKMVNSKERAHLLVIGQYDGLEGCIRQLQTERYKEYKITGVVVYDRTGKDAMKGGMIADVPVVADMEGLNQYLKQAVVDEVFLNITGSRKEQIAVAEDLLEMGITVHINLNLDMSHGFLPNQTVQNMCGCTVLTTSIKTASVYQMVVKRLMDIAGGLVGLAITGILFVIFAPIIYIQSPGPVFFTQERVGRNGRRFKMYKFRSMYMDAEERKKELMAQNKMNGLMFKMDNDPRIIPIGHLIRKLSIDEFPQFWNVLKGDMSLVGTRPPTVDEYEQYERHHRVRLAIKPGLTGMWQVSGRSDITDFEEVVKLDNQYISAWSLRLDVKILLKTVMVVLRGSGSV